MNSQVFHGHRWMIYFDGKKRVSIVPRTPFARGLIAFNQPAILVTFYLVLLAICFAMPPLWAVVFGLVALAFFAWQKRHAFYGRLSDHSARQWQSIHSRDISATEVDEAAQSLMDRETS